MRPGAPLPVLYILGPLRNFSTLCTVVLLGAAGAATTIPLGVAPAAAYDSFKVGAWRGKSVVSRRTGKFSYCIARARYTSGRQVGFVIFRSGRFALMVTDPRWNLRRGARLRMRYSIDDWWARDGVAQTLNRTSFVVRLTNLRESLPRIRRGRVLRVIFRDRRFNFSLRGTRAALKRLVFCVRNELRAERNTLPRAAPGPGGGSGPGSDAPGGLRAGPPKPGPGAGPGGGSGGGSGSGSGSGSGGGGKPAGPSDPAASGSAQFQLVAKRVAARIIKGAGLAGVFFHPHRRVPHMRQRYNGYWLGRTASGAIRLVPLRPQLTAPILAGRFRDADRKACRGKFTTGKAVAADQEALFFTRCEAGRGAKSWLIWYSMAPDAKGRYLLILVTQNKRNDADNPFVKETLKDTALRLHKSLQILIGRSGGKTTDL